MSQTISAQQAFQQVVDDLHGAGRLRVWSIIITVFGDLMPAGRDDLPASVLQSILAASFLLFIVPFPTS